MVEVPPKINVLHSDRSSQNKRHSASSDIKHTVIIPAYNEEKGLPFVLEKLQKSLDKTYEIIVVDDGSSDGTREIALEMGCKVISYSINKGKGVAMRTGIKHAKGKNIIFIDADGTYPPSAVPIIAERLEKYEMVVALRREKSNIHPLNRLGSWFFSKIMKMLYKSRVSDPLSGLYGVRREMLDKMELTSKGFEIETELTIKAARINLQVYQIHVQYDSRIGETKLRPFHDGFRILRTIFTLMFLYNPTIVFTLPGVLLFLISSALLIALLPGSLPIGKIFLSYHTTIFASLTALLGLQLSVFGTASKMYAVLHKYVQPDITTRLFTRKGFVNLLILLGVLCIGIAAYFGVEIFVLWVKSNFSPIFELRKSIFMFFLLSFGLQLIFSIVFLSIFFSEFRHDGDEQVEVSVSTGVDQSV